MNNGAGIIRIRRVPDKALSRYAPLLLDLERILFPGDKRCRPDHGHWWLAWVGKRVVGFLCIRVHGRVAFIERYGVLKAAQGRGIGRRFLRTAARYAKRVGLGAMITYTLTSNASSMNAMIAAGYHTYVPRYPMYGRNVVYWIRRIREGNV